MEENNQEEVKEQPKKSLIEETRELVEQIKKDKEEITKLRDDLQTLRSEQILSGTANAGQVQQPKEMTNSEYKDYILKHGRPPEQ